MGRISSHNRRTPVDRNITESEEPIIKLWIDDVRPAPDGYIWCKSVNQTKELIEYRERLNRVYVGHTNRGIEDEDEIELIDIDHDAGDYASDGGDYIKLLDWLEEVGYDGYIHIHSMNPVGIDNMRRIIQRNGWREI